MTSPKLWSRYCEHLCVLPQLGLSMDISRMRFAYDYFAAMEPAVRRALQEMAQLEKGAIANIDEGRRVGHYWLRKPELAPSLEIGQDIRDTLTKIKAFAKAIHKGDLQADAGPFNRLLVIGIGGSALGPQFVADALGDPKTDPMEVFFFDNTDPDGMDRVLRTLGEGLSQTLVLVISKSGGTPETRNGMLAAQAAFKTAGLDFAKHAVAITGAGSKLDQLAQEEQWLDRFAMWDWVGGRTSVTSAVGLLPAALQGLDIDSLLAGAAACDQVTRRESLRHNPAALLALMWYYATGGKGEKDMVILPYKDRLLLFSRYLQQLIMESLGKGSDLDGHHIAQGIAVYGNKGSTDQHAYVQQLREGINNFFVTFIEVREHGGHNIEVEPGVTAGDYLQGFLRGTREALYDNGRESLTLTIDRVDAFHVGVLIALYERAVGFYASLIHINAYHQPGVEAGKKAATAVIALQGQVMQLLKDRAGHKMRAAELASAIGAGNEVEAIFHALRNLAVNHPEVHEHCEGNDPARWSFWLTQ